MGKNCLNKLSGNILQPCGITQVGLKDIYLMHTEDVTLTSIGMAVSAISFASGAKSYKVEGYKQNLQYTATLKTTDASARLNTSVTFKMPADGSIMSTLATGKFYVMVQYADASAGIVGVQCPLECSAMEFDSNANAALVTVTLSDPEGSAGNAHMTCYNAVRESIISKSV
jgi:hypothetical protein